MQICYMATSVVASNTESVIVEASWIEQAISNAINSTIVQPFQNWCIGLWNGFVEVSLPTCATISLIALVLSMIGVKKANQWIVIPVIVYVFIQLTGYILGVN